MVFPVEVLEHLGVGLFLLGGLAVAAEDADVGFDHKEYIFDFGKNIWVAEGNAGIVIKGIIVQWDEKYIDFYSHRWLFNFQQ